MAGARFKYRHLGRSSAHRQALLRNLVTSLIKNESISTTYPKAKEAQRLAEKVITLGKKNTEASKRRALSIFYTPHELLPKLFGPLRERYADRPGGYTRILRIEPINNNNDQAPSAILELVDGAKDLRFAMVAKTIARERDPTIKSLMTKKGLSKRDAVSRVKDLTGLRGLTKRNATKVTQFRKDGIEALNAMVKKMEQRMITPIRLPLVPTSPQEIVAADAKAYFDRTKRVPDLQGNFHRDKKSANSADAARRLNRRNKNAKFIRRSKKAAAVKA